MKNILLMLCALIAGTAFAAAGDAQPADAVHQFIDNFNKGDVAAAEASHSTATSVTIIDEVPPYQWQGRDAFKTWLADLTKHDTAAGITDGNVKLVKQVREEISGDHAYVVMDTEYTYKAKGAAMREPSQMTFSLKKEGAAWRITGWTFSGPKPTP